MVAVNPKEDMEWFPQVGSFLWIDDRGKEQFSKPLLTLKLCSSASHAEVCFLLCMNRKLDQIPTVGFCGSGFIYGL